jgi:hypothetical protein
MERISTSIFLEILVFGIPVAIIASRDNSTFSESISPDASLSSSILLSINIGAIHCRRSLSGRRARNDLNAALNSSTRAESWLEPQSSSCGNLGGRKTWVIMYRKIEDDDIC